MVIYYDIMNCVSVKYDLPTTVLALPPFHVGAVNILQKLSRQGIRSANHWHREGSPDGFKNSVLLIALFLFQVKGLSIPRHATTEGLQLYSFLNSALDGGWVVNAKPRPLYPREQALTATVQEAEWASGPVWTGCAETYYLCAPIGGRIPNRSIVASHCTD